MENRGDDADRDDVRRVLGGEVAAFEGIVRRWQGPLVNLAYRYCRNRSTAEELAQDAFLRAYRFLDRWRDDASFSTWLFAVAANVYRSKLRRVRLPESSLDDVAPIPDPGDAPRDLEREETAEAVRRSVAALPGKYRDAVVLFYFHEMDVAAAARSLGVPEGTLKARIHRARNILRERLAKLLRPRRDAEAS
jgi:RNA polymerase sigma-70 factor, ECF subfamily